MVTNIRVDLRFSLRTALAVVTGVAVFVAAATWLHLPEEPRVESVFGGADSVDLILQPERVEAYQLAMGRTVPEPDVAPVPTIKQAVLANYPPIGEPLIVAPGTAARIGAVLVSPESYEWHVSRMCNAYFTEKLAFFRAQHRIDILFAFSCDLILIFRDGRAVGIGNLRTHASRNAVRPLIKQLFPADSPEEMAPR